MNDERKNNNQSPEGEEGEYLGKAYGGDDPVGAINEILEDASRFIAANPKKTAVIVAATVAAAVAAAVTAASFTAAMLALDEFRKRLR
jgi:hypothetical protein